MGFLLAMILAFMGSCALMPSSTEAPETERAAEVIQTEAETETETVLAETIDEEETEIITEEERESETEEVPQASLKLAWEDLGIPLFEGQTYCEVNGNVPYFTEAQLEAHPECTYSPLDLYGRCGAAYGVISENTMPVEERGQIGDIRPSGWHTEKYPGVIEGNYLYNRCHLIGYQLAGDNASQENLITGTRWLNVQGMLPFENKVADYVKTYRSQVLYRVSPVFIEDDLVAYGVMMEAKALDEKGPGLEYNVFIYNQQPGIEIDYHKGDSRLKADYDEEIRSACEWLGISYASYMGIEAIESVAVSLESERSDRAEVSDEVTYIGNMNSKKFHVPSCRSVEDMKEYNKLYWKGSREALMDQGYVPCQRCYP